MTAKNPNTHVISKASKSNQPHRQRMHGHK